MKTKTINPVIKSRSRQPRRILAASIASLVTSLLLATSDHSLAANGTWSATPTNGNWEPAGAENNWSTGAATFPGATAGVSNADVATFSSGSTQTTITINNPGGGVLNGAFLNIGGITFTGAAANYTVGGVGAFQAIYVTNGGSIQIAAGLTATNAIEAVNAPLIIDSTSINLLNNSANGAGAGAGTLNIGGSIGASGAGGTLALGGSNTNANTISGPISNNSPATTFVAGTLGITKSGAGTWVLGGANTYTGTTNITGGAILATNNSALGGGAGNTVVSSGASLVMGNGTNIAEAVTITGVGTSAVPFGAASGTMGALGVVPGGGATYSGQITVSGSATVSSNGGAITLRGGIVNNNATLTLSNTSGSVGGTINVGIAGGADPGISGGATSTVIVDSANVLFNSTNTYVGPTFIRSTLGASSGFLSTNAAGALPTATRSAVTMDDAGSLGGSRLNLIGGFNQAVASLASPNSAIGLSSIVNLNGNTLTIGTAAGNTAFFGVIGPANDLGGIIKDGASTQILAGNNGYIGNTVVQAGTLQIGNGVGGNLNGASAVTVNPAATLDLNLANGATFANNVLNNGTVRGINTGSTQTVSGVITGIGNFIQNGGGATIFTNVNTYQGGTRISGLFLPSILQIGTASQGGAAGNGAIVVDNGGTLALVNASGNAMANNITNGLGGTGTVASTTATSITLSGVISDGAAGNIVLTHNGAGNLILTGANTYTGATTVSAGEIQVGNNTALGGTGTGTTVNVGGTLRILNGITVGAEALTINGFGTANKGALAGSLGGIAAYTGPITVATNASINSAGGTLTLSGGITKNGTTLTLTGGGLGGTININSVGISGAAAGSDLVVDGLIVNLNVANTYNGPTWITNGGTLNANVANALPTAGGRSAVNFDPTVAIPGSPALFPSTGNSKLVLGANQSVLSLIGTNTTSSINLNTFTLTMGGDAATRSFAGGISGAGGVVKDTNANIQILAGANTYTGATTVTTGTLQAGSTSAFGVNSAVTVAAAGVLDLGGFSNTIGSLAGAAGALVQSTGGAPTLTTGGDNTSTTFAGVIQNGTGTLALTKTGTGTQTLSGANTYTGATTVNAGTLQVGNGATGSLAAASPVTVNNGGTLGINLVNGGTFGNAITDNTGGVVIGNNVGANVQTLSGVISGGGAVTQNGTGTTILTGANSYTGATSVNFGTLQVGNGAIGSINPSSAVTVNGGANLNIFLVNGGTFANNVVDNGTVNGLAAVGTTNTVSGAISGVGGFTQLGAGRTILTGPNIYTGATNVNAGTLQIGNGVTGSINPASPVTVLAGATLALNLANGGNLGNTVANAGTFNFLVAAPNTNTVSGVISGAGVVNQNGTGTTTVSGLNTYTGITTINNGVLYATQGTVANNSSLGFGNNTLANGTVVNGPGILRIAPGVAITTEFLTLNNGGMLQANQGGTGTFSGSILVTGAGGGTVDANGGTVTVGPINKTDSNLIFTDSQTSAPGVAVVNANGAITTTNPDALFNDDMFVTGVTTNFNAANNYFGPTIITSTNGAGGNGILNANVANALPTVNGRTEIFLDQSKFLVPTGTGSSVLNISTNQAIQALNGLASSVVNLGGNTLTIGFGIGLDLGGTPGANFLGTINGTGGITKDEISTQILSGINTYTGATNVTGGTLRAGSFQAFGVNSAVSVGAAGILDLRGNSNSIGSLSDIGGVGGIVQSTVGPATLTTGGLGANTAYAGLIQDGAGGGPLSLFINAGAGSQALSNNLSSYTGGTTLNSGTLNIDASSLAAGAVPPATGPLGTGLLTINGGIIGTTSATGGTVDRNIGNAVQINNSFSVSSSDGANLVGGPVIADGVTFNGPVLLTTTATINTISGYLNLAGVVSDGGAGNGLTFTGNSFTLLGAGGPGDAPNTYTGLTTVSGGLVLMNKGAAVPGADGVAIAGNVQVDSGALLQTLSNFLSGGTTPDNQIAQTASALVNGTLDTGGTNQTLDNLSGSGAVQLSDAAVNAAFAGGAPGTTAGILTVNSGVFSGGIADSGFGGQLVKNSTGAFFLNGTNTYVGNTTINNGSLFVNGSTASANTFVNVLGLLGGTGTIGGNVFNRGIVAPGNSVGTLTVTGNYVQASTGRLDIQVDGRTPKSIDRLVVGGTASLDGTLRITNINGTKLKRGDKLTFLVANGGVNGEFANVSNPFATGKMLSGEVVYHTTSVALEVVQNSFGQFAEFKGATPNQRAVARLIDQVAYDSDQTTLIDYLNNQPLSNLLNDFDLIAPEEFQAIYTIGISQANVQTANLSRRMDDIRSGSAGFTASGLAVSGMMPQYSGNYLMPNNGVAGPEGKMGKELRAPVDNRVGVFFTGFGEFSNIGATYNATGYDLSSAGFTLGLDYRVNEKFAMGINVGYGRTNASLFGTGKINLDGLKLGLYATYFDRGFYIDASAQGGFNTYDTRRTALQGTATGSTDGTEFNGLLAVGYDYRRGGLSVGPLASVQYTRVGFDSFGETGSLAPLTYANQSGYSLRTALGAKAAYEIRAGSVIIKPEVRAAWQHEFGDTAFGIQSNLANGGGSTLTVHGAEIGRDSLLLGAGFAVLWNERTSTYVYYDGELGRTNFTSNNVSGGVRVEF